MSGDYSVRRERWIDAILQPYNYSVADHFELVDLVDVVLVLTILEHVAELFKTGLSLYFTRYRTCRLLQNLSVQSAHLGSIVNKKLALASYFLLAALLLEARPHAATLLLNARTEMSLGYHAARDSSASLEHAAAHGRHQGARLFYSH